MDDAAIRKSIVTHLQQAHAMERAQVPELRTLAQEMQVPSVAALLSRHQEATRGHGDRLEERLEELGAGSSLRLLTQAFGVAIPKTFVDRLRPNSTLATLRDAIAVEAGEVVSYLLLEMEALRGGDESTAVLAAELRADEAGMRDELMTYWNQAVDVYLASLPASREQSDTQVLRAIVVDHLQDIHALQRNAVIMEATVLATVRDELATTRISDHRASTSRQADAVRDRLRELGGRPSLRKQAQGYAFAALKGPVNLVRAERAAKDLRDLYVVEHFELVAYSQLEVFAERLGDDRTLDLARAHAAEAVSMADWLEREGARFLLESMRARA